MKDILNQEISSSLEELRDLLKALSSFYHKKLNYSDMVYELWSAKDILGHLVFWHESFARNISDLGEHRTPNVLKGKLSEVNQQSVESTRPYNIDTLLARLKSAQRLIEKYIFNQNINLIPYKKGSRSYSRLEHLQVVNRHIKRHLKDLEKHYKITEMK